MGGGFYSASASVVRRMDSGAYTKSAHESFTSRNLNEEMNPKGLDFREARDSEEHPNSLPIIIGLDVTASMGSVPHELIKDGLNKIMGNVIQNGIPDPQVLFLGIGDHECDRAPLQVGQFESSDELCDEWLKKVYVERGGGGNGGESYLLAWYAARYTRTDQFEKRGKKGFLFTIGDEPNLQSLPKNTQEALMGNGNYEDLTADDLLKEASKMYDVYHINVETFSGSQDRVQDGWKQTLQDHFVSVKSADDVPFAIAEIIAKRDGQGEVVIKDVADIVANETEGVTKVESTAIDDDNLGFM